MKKDFLLRLQTHPQQPAERKRPVSMAFRLEDRGDNYLKLAWGGVETHPRQSHLQKERPVCISIEGHGDHYIKVNYGVVLLLELMSTTRKNLTKGKRKGSRSQSSEHLRPVNNCILRRIIRSQLRLNHQGSRLLHHNLCCSSSYTTKALEYYTESPKYYTTKAPENTQLRMLPQPTTPRLQLITPPKLSNTTQERPSTIEISRVSFSDTHHGSPEVANKLRLKHWNGKQ
ncbi:hypothetical protein DAPPUDRAFT_254045 [Daphnia pulex]|uniref:Uncharacterized protein n=1 Tax=Daphnia pulex TaxID=6669 RepID=E9H664_DAPPU|nr:hypothetical protein DAPPUDRAFT_254045 [Daphnia pulex]|eukprot:EFX72754.1 hypothetical protein DAPPUDRAFT_254045 [Daphnia pulex]